MIGFVGISQTPTDDCGLNAGNQLPVNSGCVPLTFTIDTPLGNPANPACGLTGTGEDGWGWFTANSNSTTVSYSNTNRDAMIFIYTDNGTPCTGLTQIACVDDYGAGAGTESITFATTPGVNYYVRIVRFTGTSGVMSGTICVYSLPSVVNDPCSGAIPVLCGQSIAGTTVGAAPETIPPGCGSTVSPSLWYSIVGDGSTFIIDLCGSGFDTNLSLYTGDCNGLTCLQYNDDFCGLQSSLTFNSVNGEVYYIQVHGFGSASGDFILNIDCYTESGNDPCSGALPITCNQTIAGSTSSFNPDIIPGGCGFSVSGGVWYSFEGTGDMITASLCGSAYDTQISVFTGSCAGLNCINTNDDLCGLQSEVAFLSYAGTTYYILVHGVYEEGSFSLGLTCEPYVASPQDCGGAIPICTDTQFGGNSSGAGFSNDLNALNQGCLYGENQTSWYIFQPTTTGTIGFTINPTPIVDYDFAIWGPMASPTCPPAGTPLRCSFSALYQPTGLGGGATDLTEGAAGNAWVSPITVTSTEVNAYYIMCLDNFSSTTTPFVFDWALSGVVLNCSIVLPVELTSFSGREEGHNNLLEWITASELNNERFEIWSSADGVNYSVIGEVNGQGTCHVEHRYEFTDRNPSGFLTYYKLRQVDFNGSAQWSNVIAVSRSGLISVAPNPVENAVRIQFNFSHLQELSIQIADVSGRVVKKLAVSQIQQGDKIDWNLHDLQSGVFYLTGSDAQGQVLFTERLLRK